MLNCLYLREDSEGTSVPQDVRVVFSQRMIGSSSVSLILQLLYVKECTVSERLRHRDLRCVNSVTVPVLHLAMRHDMADH